MQRLIRWMMMGTIAMLASWAAEGSARAQVLCQADYPLISSYNYCVGPGWPAQLYPCPRPTPPYVGHTYITYEPLAPHNFLYRHRRVYTGPAGIPGQPRVTVLWW